MDIIDTVNDLRSVAHTDLAAQVRNVAVILTSPRSGSSLLKSVLATHPDIASLDGEMEPFLTLTRNGFSGNADSDAFTQLRNKSALIDNIFDDMTMVAEDGTDYDLLRGRWEKRLLLQFPALFSQQPAYQQLQEDLIEFFAHTDELHQQTENRLQDSILAKIFKNEIWRLDYYDGKKKSMCSHCFDEAIKLEEPPFVMPRQHRRKITASDLTDKILLFKTPPDVYRMGLYEQLFPNATIKYLHLTRGYAQSVNGLIDGWLSPVAFFSRDMSKVGISLNIRGYSDRVDFGERWWKFDLPPNWRQFINASLEDVCLNQWLSAHRAIFDSQVKTLRVSFEAFISHPGDVIKEITDYLNLKDMGALPVFPVTMATEAPKLRRWEKRRDCLLRLGEREEVKTMMNELDYQMDPQTWL